MGKPVDRDPSPPLQMKGCQPSTIKKIVMSTDEPIRLQPQAAEHLRIGFRQCPTLSVAVSSVCVCGRCACINL
jgi:hypothetical protein